MMQAVELMIRVHLLLLIDPVTVASEKDLKMLQASEKDPAMMLNLPAELMIVKLYFMRVPFELRFDQEKKLSN